MAGAAWPQPGIDAVCLEAAFQQYFAGVLAQLRLQAGNIGAGAAHLYRHLGITQSPFGGVLMDLPEVHAVQVWVVQKIIEAIDH